MKRVSVNAVLFALIVATSALAAQPSDGVALRAEIERLRQELNDLRHAYDARLNELEATLAQHEPEASAPLVAPISSASSPEGALPVYGNVSALSKISTLTWLSSGTSLEQAARILPSRRPR